MSRRIILYICIYFLLVISGGCKKQSEISRQLYAVEKLMDTKPDSAYTLLKNVDAKQLSGKQEEALYALLYTQAQHKNYVNIKDDSLINIAVDYYLKGKDEKRRADAIMYQGCVLSGLKDYKNAIDAYKQAESIYQKIQDFKCLGLANTRLAEVHGKAYTDDSLIVAYEKKAASYYRMAKDTVRETRTFGVIGAQYSLFNVDSAFYYLNLAKKRAIANQDQVTLKLVDYVLMSIFNTLGEYDQAKRIGLSETYREHINPRIQRQLCHSYLYTNQIDSAKLIYAQIKNQITKINQYDLQTEIYLAEGNYKEAFNWLKKTRQFADSILNSENKSSLLMADRRFDYQKILSQKKQAEYKSTLKTYIITIICLALFGCIIALIAIRSLNERHKHKIQEQLAFIEQLNAELIRHTESNDIALRQLEQYSDRGKEVKAAIERRLQMFDKLLEVSYRYNTSDAVFLKEAKRILDTCIISSEMITDVCEIINLHNSYVIDRLKTTHPALSQNDLYYISLLIAGFSPVVIALLFNYSSVDVVYVRKARIGKKLKLDLPLEKYLELLIHSNK